MVFGQKSTSEWMTMSTVNPIDNIVYAGRVKNTDILMKSSSGGAFTALSDVFLDNKEAVACTVYNYTDHTAEFCLITNKEERDAARGSKYMQSKLGNIYFDIMVWMKKNPEKKLLFIGMGCQADGFRHFAEISGIRSRVWIVDIICHGTPSPKLWREYAASLEKKYKGTISDLSFKDKINGWKNPTAKVIIRGQEVLIKDFVKVFYSRCALRPSCHECPYATMERQTDITIGDFWHIEDKIPDFYDPNGNSLFLIHTEKGAKLFDSIKTTIEYRGSNTKDCWQENLERPTPVSDKRAEFWNDYQTKGIDFIMHKYGTVSLQTRVKNRILKIMRGGYC
ncbi:Coenzyme F420 hydrogenase/dehydrogenase, beta subunit C-terminal domain [Eisenbergiella sp.]